ncbi:hypothetical protein [Campylobacter californiensis]|uniref:hypothetical protein n=1 Tax=Campylobacter californiensis TaxID=1032243 RepID=UPI001472AC13|nr:hypothetical protein [Campylobacter sp. RM12916]MBE3610516.1 hypothetical protein [Campylobacter sp. RM12916]
MMTDEELETLAKATIDETMGYLHDVSEHLIELAEIIQTEPDRLVRMLGLIVRNKTERQKNDNHTK